MSKIKKTIIDYILNKLPDNIREEIYLTRKYFYFKSNSCKVLPKYIYTLDGRNYTHGLADRLRGMISIYLYSKINNVEFKIEHIVPFKLEDYLQPNEYDWCIKEGDLSYNLKYSNPICLFDYTKGKRLFYLPRKRQYHFYTNINCINLINNKYKTNYSFNTLYNELFKPSPLLEKEISKCLNEINSKYISISFRFMQLLGDFKDSWGKTYSCEEQNLLIEKCINCVKELRYSIPDNYKILVTADSQKFINKVNSLPFVYIIPGEIGHIGNTPNQNSFLKTFLDFYMISKAEKIYLGVTGDMYKSNYAKTAAAISNHPFEIIQF